MLNSCVTSTREHVRNVVAFEADSLACALGVAEERHSEIQSQAIGCLTGNFCRHSNRPIPRGGPKSETPLDQTVRTSTGPQSRTQSNAGQLKQNLKTIFWMMLGWEVFLFPQKLQWEREQRMWFQIPGR